MKPSIGTEIVRGLLNCLAIIVGVASLGATVAVGIVMTRETNPVLGVGCAVIMLIGVVEMVRTLTPKQRPD